MSDLNIGNLTTIYRKFLISKILIFLFYNCAIASEILSCRPEIQDLFDTGIHCIKIGRVTPEQISKFYIVFSNSSSHEIVFMESHASCSCFIVSGSLTLLPFTSGSLLFTVSAPYKPATYQLENITKWKVKDTAKEIIYRLSIQQEVFDGITTSKHHINLGEFLQGKSISSSLEYTLMDPQIDKTTFRIYSKLNQANLELLDLEDNRFKCEINIDSTSLAPGSYSTNIHAECKTRNASNYHKNTFLSFYLQGDLESVPRSAYISCHNGLASGSLAITSKSNDVNFEKSHFSFSSNISMTEIKYLSKSEMVLSYKVHASNADKAEVGLIEVLSMDKKPVLHIPVYISHGSARKE